jgi:hypothetical protein
MSHGYSNSYSADIFWITFDKNKIEVCGFHRSKEEMKMHRIIQYELLNMIFKGFQSTSLKKPTPWDVYSELSVFQMQIQTVHGISTKLHNIQMFRINYSGIIGIVVHALSDFSTNFCKNWFFDKIHFFRHFENWLNKIQTTY